MKYTRRKVFQKLQKDVYKRQVIHTVGHIGVLLDLRDQDILANGMNRAGFNKKNVTLLYFDRIENLKKRIVFDTLCKLFLADLTVETIIKISAFLTAVSYTHLF